MGTAAMRKRSRGIIRREKWRPHRESNLEPIDQETVENRLNSSESMGGCDLIGFFEATD